MARGVKHNDETRAAAIAALLTGQGVCEVAKAYKLPQSVVSRLKAEIPQHKLDEVGLQKAHNFDVLLSDLAAANIRALTMIANTVSNEDYIRKQPADQIAVLAGVLTDKTVRLFEAAQAGGIE